MNRYTELENCRVWADLALEHFGLETGLLPVRWNGRLIRRMGQARCKRALDGIRSASLEFSPKLFERATPEEREETAAHEAAHGVVWLVHGPIRRGRQMDHHGPVWQGTMRALGFEPKRCHNVDTTGLGRKHIKLSCKRCGGSLGACSPKKAARLVRSYNVKLRCCGTQPGSMILAIDTRG